MKNMKNLILWLLVYAAAIAAALVVVWVIFAIPELISEHAPWGGWIGAAALVFAGMRYLYRRGWGKEGDDNASL